MEEFYLIDDYLAQETTTVTGWPDIDLFSHWHRKTPYSQLSMLLERSWNKTPYDTLVMLFYLRNCRGKGKGERYQFYQGIRWFMEHHPEQILANFRLLPEFGYWKDLLNIWNSGNETLRAFIVFAYCQQLKKDLQSLQNGNKISLVAKWAPTEKCADDRKWGFVGIFCDQLNWSRKVYRQNISKLRDVLGITERLASIRRWGEIDFPDIPVKSRLNFHQTLQKYCGRRYERWCSNSNNNPPSIALYDLVVTLRNGINPDIANSEWNEHSRQGIKSFGDTLCVCDVSPSMDSSLNRSPLNVAIALTLLLSSKSNEPYRNKVITFSETPELVTITGETPTEKVQTLQNVKWGYTIDINAIIQLLIEKKLSPKQLFIFTDRDWNSSTFPTRFEHSYDELKIEFEKHSLTPPEQIYFWNLGGRWGSCSFNMDYHDNGIIIINGFTPEMFNSVTQTSHLYPWILLKQILRDPIYARVKLV